MTTAPAGAVRYHTLELYNSWSRTKEEFRPLVPGHVGIYVCGPTVYSDTHLGHAKSYVSFDVIVRYLRHLGYRVRYIQNITDVGHLTDNADEGEDKILKRARLDQVHPMELAEHYTRNYFRDMDALGVQRPDISPRATQHIPEQIAIIRKLIEAGHAYAVEGNVYFSVASWPEYGRLSGRQAEEAEQGYRVQVRTDKRDPRDFALWKSAEGGHILRWESPWGWGYPGWHIECTAMSVKYLGEEFDLHGAGIDNLFPHHECEIAQARAAGLPFARTWIHNNLIQVDGQKMSKSLGNYVTVQDALNRHEATAIRFWILGTHYRSPANYTDEALAAAKGGLVRIRTCLKAVEARRATAPKGVQEGDRALRAAVEAGNASFHTAMDDDINTPLAIAALFELVREINVLLGKRTPISRQALDEAAALFGELAGSVLGVLEDAEAAPGPSIDPFIELLIDVRTDLKNRREFALADQVRSRLGELGIELKDSKEGTTWSRK